MSTARDIAEDGGSPAGRAAFHRWLVWIGLGVLLWMSLVKFPASPAAALDPSWQMTLAYAAVHHLQFGSDLVFTYGPLGYLAGATNIGELYRHHLLWQLVSNAVFAGLIVVGGRSLRGWQAAAYFACFLFLVSPSLDIVQMAVILGLGIVLVNDRLKSRTGLAGAIATLFAVLALVKFTNLLLIGFTLLCVTAHHLWKRRWIDLSVLLAVFWVMFVAIWMMLGQRPSHIPEFVVNSAKVSAGYSEAMALVEKPGMLLLGLGAGFSVTIGYGLNLIRATDFPRSLTTVLLVIAAVFMNWKHGFIRADSHVLVHFVFCLLLAAVHPVIFPQQAKAGRRFKFILLSICVILSLRGIHLAAPGTFVDALSAWNARLKEVGRAVASAGDLVPAARQQYVGIRNVHIMPEFKALAGNRSVDVLGHDQAYAVFNDVNFRPRPVFQSYSAYTGDLLRLNEKYYQSPRGPEFVLQKMEVVDGRLPGLEDSLVTRHLYHHYTYIAQERGFLIWQRQSVNPENDRRTPLAASTIPLSQTFTVPLSGDAPVWVELDLQPSWLGRLRNFLYKSPVVALNVTDSEDFQTRYRLVPDMARAGFLANPHFTSNDQIARFEAGTAVPRIAAFTIDVPAAERKFFRQPVTVRLFTLAPFPRRAPASEGEPSKFRMFSHEPSAVNALFPVSVVPENGQDVLFAHPPSDLTFDVSTPVRRVTGGFGMTAGTYAPPNRTDGADFILEWTGADGQTTAVFRRTLRPVDVEGDRGRQAFDVALPDGKGRLVLRITPGAANDIAFDWTYWSDLKFIE